MTMTTANFVFTFFALLPFIFFFLLILMPPPSFLPYLRHHLLLRTRTGRYMHNVGYSLGRDSGLSRNRPGLPFYLTVENVQPDPDYPPDWRWLCIPDSTIGRPIPLPFSVGPGRSTPQQALTTYLDLLRREDALLIGHVQVRVDSATKFKQFAQYETWYKSNSGEMLTTSQLIMQAASGGSLYGWHAVSEKAKKFSRTLGDKGARPVLRAWLTLAGRQDLAVKYEDVAETGGGGGDNGEGDGY